MAQHLIHIGYPKAGSTFLQAWFESHPELRYAHAGLGGFQDVYAMCRLEETTYRYYVTSCEDLSSPHGSTEGLPGETAGQPERIKDAQAEVCALLKTLYPGSRILIVTRGFREIAFSGYSQYVRFGGVQHLEGMVGMYLDRLGEDADHYYDFDHLVGLYADAFGPENLIVLPFELLRDDQARFLAVLEEALGVSHVEVELGRVNPTLSPEELYWYPVISRLAESVAARLGPRRSRRVFHRYVDIPFRNRLRPLIRMLARLSPSRRIDRDDFPEGLLSQCVGKADGLRDHPLYAPYAREYLWDVAPPRHPTRRRIPLPEGAPGDPAPDPRT